MTLPSGTFSSPYAGTLRVTVSASWNEVHGSANNGWPASPSGTSDSNIQMHAYAGPSGSLTYGAPFDKFNPSVTHDVAYPGGSVVWNVGVSEIAHYEGAALHYGFDPIKLTVQLIKK